MMPNGLNLKAKKASRGNIGTCRPEDWKFMDFHRKVLILRDTFVNFLKKQRICCIHSKIMLLGCPKSTPLSRIRHGVAVSSREFEGHIADPR